MSIRSDIDLFLNTLEKMLPFSEREEKLVKLSYELGKCVKEDEIVYLRKLFEEEK